MKTTIILPISRPTFLSRIFPALEFMICERENTNLITYVDGDIKLYEIARNYTETSKFNERLCIFRNKGIANPSSIKGRRQRISDIHNEIKGYIKNTDFIFLTEDDTLLHPSTLRRLQQTYINYPHAGMVSGVQVGRWGLRYVGLWKVDNVYDTKEISSLTLSQGEQKIDASGFYCLLTKKENYIKHNFKPYEDILGPDFDYGIKLRQQGFDNYVNFSVNCLHLTPKEDIKVENIQTVSYEKRHYKWWQKI